MRSTNTRKLMPYNLLVLQLVSKRNILFTYLFYTFFRKMDSRDRFYGFSLLFNIFAEKKTYYAGIMLDAPSIVLCSKLCRHNVSDPIVERLNCNLLTKETVRIPNLCITVKFSCRMKWRKACRQQFNRQQRIFLKMKTGKTKLINCMSGHRIYHLMT